MYETLRNPTDWTSFGPAHSDLWLLSFIYLHETDTYKKLLKQNFFEQTTQLMKGGSLQSHLSYCLSKAEMDPVPIRILDRPATDRSATGRYIVLTNLLFLYKSIQKTSTQSQECLPDNTYTAFG
jgi:hypothetical protein